MPNPHNQSDYEDLVREKQQRMTDSELETERRYRVKEYLGNLIEAAMPTPSQLDEANAEADRVIAILRERKNKPK